MTQTAPQRSAAPALPENPWPALWALCLGFFMILVDTTIVTVATPAIMEDLDADVNAVVWVTSAYLLAYAVPVLITGRLGDRYGPKRLYLIGLVLFTLASLWCGLTGSITGLVLARVAQGLGASMMTPQTMAVITRIFPASRRGSAMALWGATAGVATLVGPILGGVLVDLAGWEWIFFINVPVGIVAFVLAWRLVPRLDTHPHRFDWLGVALSGVGMFLLVFGLQEGQTYDWGTITGPISVWSLIVTGLVVLALFVWWQARNRAEPLVPLSLFTDRNFSLANLAIATVSFGFTAMGFPLMLYAQLVRGWSPTQSGLLLVPLAVGSILLARPVGRLSDRVHPRILTSFGFVAMGGALVWIAMILAPRTPVWELLVPLGLLGVGSAFLWSVLSTTANRNLPVQQAGAGAGVYNATRQVGAVLGSAGIAVLMQSRLAANGLGGAHGGGSPETAMASGGLPEQAWPAFSQAMGEAMLLIPAVLLLGLLAVLAFEGMKHER
ncbi:DHA2 family efflux MFS transporter permease subunit [Nocardioides campestrisoli]|uniref:DHA2 family efflux MFS transporter permease subunit n=1 Tax=Nocardioides campestrisoli TaxID=2736757 RepID=UPI0015E63F6E|nr:DHA2 family efflux MFS transporter permease subunit [Nocardioides campestrisoli]